MTVFLAVTALVNIALGYGLATYLGHPEWPLRRKRAAGPPVEESVHEDEELTVVVGAKPAMAAAPAPLPSRTPMLSSAVEPPMAAAPPSVTAAPDAKATLPPTAAGETTTAAAEPELEQQMLAGIEEFRNQLAQMKAQPDASSAAATAAATA